MDEKLYYIKNSIRNAFKEFDLGTKKMFKEFFNKETNKKQRANMWTFTRLIIPFITLISSVCAIMASSPILFILTGLIAGFGAITDYFDGKSSRKHKSSSEYGKQLDQISDKVFAGIIGINLLFLNPNYIFILIGELLISSINIAYKLKHNDLKISSTKTGKIKEWPLFFTLALGFLSPINQALITISNISIVITNLFQILTYASYIESNEKELKQLKRNKICGKVDAFIEEDKLSNEKELKKEEITKLEQYKKLREVLNEIINIKQKTNEENINNYQKIKEL